MQINAWTFRITLEVYNLSIIILLKIDHLLSSF